MTVCRYFLQGTCRFGDRCRFEHVENNFNQQSYNYNQRNPGNYNERYGRPESGYTNYNRNDKQYRNQEYKSRGHYNEDYRNYSPERYSETYPNYSEGRYSENYRSQPTRTSDYGQGYEHQNRYSEHNYGQKQQQYTNYRENENVYNNQNRYRWQSDDYKNQVHQSTGHDENEYLTNSYKTSTPKGKSAFSFKVPESEIKKPNSTFFQVNEEEQLYAENVKEDAKSWEYGGQWPFTCYFPYPNKCGFPGFYDVSPEELRYAAYKSEKDNSYDAYVQATQNALTQINQQISQLQVVTPELLSTLRRMRNGEDLYSTSKMIDPIGSIHHDVTVVEDMETPALPHPATNSAATFSFKMLTETDSTVKTSASNFSFKLPAGTDTKAVSSSAPDGDTNVYTPLANLTDEEKEQFSASTFVLGKIPTKPPPLALCT